MTKNKHTLGLMLDPSFFTHPIYVSKCFWSSLSSKFNEDQPLSPMYNPGISHWFLLSELLAPMLNPQQNSRSDPFEMEAKRKSDNFVPLLQILQWLPILFRGNIIIMTYKTFMICYLSLSFPLQTHIFLTHY